MLHGWAEGTFFPKMTMLACPVRPKHRPSANVCPSRGPCSGVAEPSLFPLRFKQDRPQSAPPTPRVVSWSGGGSPEAKRKLLWREGSHPEDMSGPMSSEFPEVGPDMPTRRGVKGSLGLMDVSVRIPRGIRVCPQQL